MNLRANPTPAPENRSSRRGFIGGAMAVGAAAVLTGADDAQAAVTGPPEVLLNPATTDGSADESAALTAALTAVGNQGGGTVLIPPGTFKISSPVYVSFSGVTSGIRIRGVGPASRFLIAAGQTADAISLVNLDDFVMTNVNFLGAPDLPPTDLTDAKRSLVFASAHATLVGVGFYDLASRVVDGAVLYTNHADLLLKGCTFRGCGGAGLSGPGVSVVECRSWRSVLIEDCEFIDYGFITGKYQTKTGGSHAAAWVRLRDATNENMQLDQPRVTVQRTIFDEAQHQALRIDPNPATSPRIATVLVDDVRINGSSQPDGQGIHVEYAEQVTVRDTTVGYQTNGPVRDAVYCSNCYQVYLDHVRGKADFTRLTTTGGTKSLTVRNSSFSSIVSDAPVQHVGSSYALLDANGDPVAPPANGSVSAARLDPGLLAGLPFGVPFVSGRYYSNLGFGLTVFSARPGYMAGAPFWLQEPLEIDRIGMKIQRAGAAGSTLRLGIFATDPTGLPGRLLINAGTVPADTAATKEVDLIAAGLAKAARTLPAGLVWLTILAVGGSPMVAGWSGGASIGQTSLVRAAGDAQSTVLSFGPAEGTLTDLVSPWPSPNAYSDPAPKIVIRAA